MITPVSEWISKTEKLIEGVTPGPWVPDFGNWQIESRNERSYRNGVCMFADDNRYCMDGSINPLCMVEDAKFIADARTSLPIALKLIAMYRIALNSISHPLNKEKKELDFEELYEVIMTDIDIAKEALDYWPED